MEDFTRSKLGIQLFGERRAGLRQGGSSSLSGHCTLKAAARVIEKLGIEKRVIENGGIKNMTKNGSFACKASKSSQMLVQWRDFLSSPVILSQICTTTRFSGIYLQQSEK